MGDEPGDEEDDAPPESVGVMNDVAAVDGITIWGHGALPDLGDDPYARGIQEWVAFAQAVSPLFLAQLLHTDQRLVTSVAVRTAQWNSPGLSTAGSECLMSTRGTF